MAISTPTPSSTIPRGPITANINFTHPPPAGTTAYNYVDAPPAGQAQRNIETNPQPVPITDIRGQESSYNLDRDAFQIIASQPPSAEVLFEDDASIESNYYPEVEKLLLHHIPNSTRVVIFDHTVRRAGPNAKRSAVQYAHIDQTAYSTQKRVRRHIEDADEAEALLHNRYRIVNVWRTLNAKPVEAMPLAFASSASLDQKDVIPVKHIYSTGYEGETAAIAHNPEQRWHYLSGMTGDERILLECFDSEGLREGSGVEGGRVPHSAFEDPRTRADAEGRESIEVRALVFGP
ncbi:Uu.00g072830.m01.CDS01 [Anthostomella pinea]|uniref:Uu.00g072830.m01.CDS01 n=1 Tax=Anthostomella pinea TaxID=933095 RepID=A0AAI8YNV5_9PEZI|nr:Uu.00g072830.m01.CDS01 [Anthostomella pinea]